MRTISLIGLVYAATYGGLLETRAQDHEQKRAYHAGADASIILRCIDQDGQPVADAVVSSALYPDGSLINAIVNNGNTDSNGLFAIKGKTNGEYSFGLTKSGYYKTRMVRHLSREKAATVISGRWQPYGMTNTVVLKRIVNPVAMHVKWNSLKNFFPSQGMLYGYDMEAGDWVKPFGKGIVADFHARHERRTGAKPLDITTSLTLLFTNAMDGAYCMKADTSGSAMKTVIRANTNALYLKEFVFTYERTPGKVRTNTYPTLADYFVLRTRTEVDEHGAIKRAHYAKIVGKCGVAKSDRFDFFYYFNPNTNDPNLEADTTRNLLNPRDLGFAP